MLLKSWLMLGKQIVGDPKKPIQRFDLIQKSPALVLSHFNQVHRTYPILGLYRAQLSGD